MVQAVLLTPQNTLLAPTKSSNIEVPDPVLQVATFQLCWSNLGKGVPD